MWALHPIDAWALRNFVKEESDPSINDEVCPISQLLFGYNNKWAINICASYNGLYYYY
jgi:hypothetical protein